MFRPPRTPRPDRFGVGDYLLRIGFSSSSKLTPATLGDRLSSEKAMVRCIAFLLTFVALAFPALADEGHHHDDLSEQQFGSVHFPTSCNPKVQRSEEHTSELQSPCNLVCRLLLEKKKTTLTQYSLNRSPLQCTNQ